MYFSYLSIIAFWVGYSRDVMNKVLPSYDHLENPDEHVGTGRSTGEDYPSALSQVPSDLLYSSPPAMEVANLVAKGKQCFTTVQNVLHDPYDTESQIELRKLQTDGIILVDNAIHAKLHCEARICVLEREIEELNNEIDDYKKYIEVLKKKESDADIDIYDKEAELKFEQVELRRVEAEVEAAKAEQRYQQAQKKAAKSKMIGAGLGALVAAFTDDDTWTAVGGAIGGVVAEIDGKIQQKNRKLIHCKVALETAERAVIEARESLGKIRQKIEEYKSRIVQKNKDIDKAMETITAIEKLMAFQKQSANFWSAFSAAASASLDHTEPKLLAELVRSGEEVVDVAQISNVLKVAKPCLETWELLSLIDLKDLF